MPRWEPDANLRLVEAAVELFTEQGYDATSVAEIAERAGLTKTTFFRHFPDKREVLSAGQDAHCQLLTAAILSAPGDATPLQLVRTAIDALARAYPPERRDFARRVHELVHGSDDLRERSELKTAGYVSAVLDGLHARGVDDPTAVVAAELGVLAFTTAFATWACASAPTPLPELVSRTLAELHAAGLSLR
jgi:AcrR family transcriptional regulator